MKKVSFLLLVFSFVVYAFAQPSMEGKTYLYKRVMIVENGVKSPKDDDAHYITFTFKGCHESDKDGFDAKHGFVDYTKDENNLHCYYGSCFYGKAHYYFSNDYMRLNVQINENLVYVYQREPSGKTTAKLRGAYPETNGGGGVVVVPTPIIDIGGGTSGGSSNSNRSSYIKCRSCNGTGNCQSCKGKGHSSIWGEKYQECMGCNGSGRCTVCYGTGRIVSY